MDVSPNLGLPYLAAAQAQKHVTHNEALRRLDALVHLSVVDRDLTTPPPAPVDGARYLVAAAAGNAWSGQDGRIAAFQDGGWQFLVPAPGWLAWIEDEGLLLAWDGAAWTPVPGAVDLNPVALVGINATADTTNRLAVRSPASLFDHDGGGHQLKLNKSAAGETASILLQDGYSGRAEIGLAGDNDLRIKVSADGGAWREALRIDRASGEMVAGHLRLGRDTLQNVLPDSGRFNGNASNSVFASITFAAPSYLVAVSGGAVGMHAKFIHNNNDYGGAAGALDSEVKALIDKIRPVGGRRYGPEWFALQVTNSAASLIGSRSIGATTYGVALLAATVALPRRFTLAYHVKAKAGQVAIAVDSANVVRAAIDGLPVPAGPGASPVVLTNADGWKHVCLESLPNAYSYEQQIFRLLTPLAGEFWLAMPQLVFGHCALDAELGVLMNGRLFG